jgi:hypothetical protein
LKNYPVHIVHPVFPLPTYHLPPITYHLPPITSYLSPPTSPLKLSCN